METFKQDFFEKCSEIGIRYREAHRIWTQSHLVSIKKPINPGLIALIRLTKILNGDPDDPEPHELPPFND